MSLFCEKFSQNKCLMINCLNNCRFRISRITASYCFCLILISFLSFQIMNNSSFTASELSVLAVPQWLAYSLIAVYSGVIICAGLGSILIITAVTRTKSNVYIGTQNFFSQTVTKQNRFSLLIHAFCHKTL